MISLRVACRDGRPVGSKGFVDDAAEKEELDVVELPKRVLGARVRLALLANDDHCRQYGRQKRIFGGDAMKRRKRKTKRLEPPDESHARGRITHRRRRLLPIWSVRHLPDGTQAFFNTKRECLEWIKRWKED